MKGWAAKWSSFPAAHKRRGLQGLAAYGLVTALTAGWVAWHAQDTMKDWRSRTPSASADIKNVYLTPQIESSGASDTQDFPGNLGAAPVVVDDGKTYVSIVVTGLGLSSLATERALNDLPPQITLAFSPYGEKVRTWISKALAAHHETLMQMPMETADYPKDDPGPKALSSRFSDTDNDDNLNWMLAEGRGSAGVINLMGSRFLTDKKRLGAVFGTLRKNNVMFVETPQASEKSVAFSVAAGLGLPYMPANLQIDAVATDRDIRAQLDNLEQAARKNGYAVGIAQPYPLTLNILKSWATELDGRGITLAPLKTVYKNKPHHNSVPAPKAAPSQPAEQPVVQPSAEQPPADQLKQPAK